MIYTEITNQAAQQHSNLDMSSTTDSHLSNGKRCDWNVPVSCDENGHSSDQSVPEDINDSEGLASYSVSDSVCFHSASGLPKHQHIITRGTTVLSTAEQNAEERLRMRIECEKGDDNGNEYSFHGANKVDDKNGNDDDKNNDDENEYEYDNDRDSKNDHDIEKNGSHNNRNSEYLRDNE